jgi:hypothetical protein
MDCITWNPWELHTTAITHFWVAIVCFGCESIGALKNSKHRTSWGRFRKSVFGKMNILLCIYTFPTVWNLSILLCRDATVWIEHPVLAFISEVLACWMFYIGLVVSGIAAVSDSALGSWHDILRLMRLLWWLVRFINNWSITVLCHCRFSSMVGISTSSGLLTEGDGT